MAYDLYYIYMVKDFIKRELSSDTFKYVLILVLVVAILNYNFLNQFKQLPSPIYGGDYYNHLGSMYHIYYGGSIFENGQMKGEIQWAPWLYHLFVVILSKITGLDPLFGIIYSSIPLIFISAIIIYLIIKRFTENQFLILPVLLFFLVAYPIYKYTLFAFFFTSPLMILAWFLFIEKQTRNRFVFLAIAIALAHLSSTQLFFSSIILFSIIVLDIFYKHFKNSENNLGVISSKNFIQEVTPFLKVFIAGFVLSLVYWYWPIFVYKGATPNDIQVYGWPDYTKFDFQISTITDGLRDTFFTFNFNKTEATLYSLTSILQLIGSIAIILNRNKNIFYRLSFLILVSALIGLTHHLVMFNLLHAHLSPGHLFQMLQSPLAPIEVILALLFIKDKIKIGTNGNAKFVEFLFIIFAVLFFLNHFSSLEENKNGNWVEAGRQDLSPLFKDLRAWILTNTNVDDVFITTNEDGFMLNALTGRKTVSYRRTHAPVYTDMNQRMLDNAVILYGKNDELRKELLKKYNVKYLFWSVRWFENEFQIQNGQIVGLFDPLMVKDKPEYLAYLDNNGLKYGKIHTSLDPYSPPELPYPTYDILVVLPANPDISHPWDKDLDKYIKPAKQIGVQNGDQLEVFGIIYQVNVN